MEYRFDQIAYNSTEKKQPEDLDRAHYIGLEHLNSGSFEVTRWGSDVTPTGEKLVMRKGDVLFGKRRAYQRKVGIAPFDGIFSAHGMVLRPKENIIDKDFFPFFIASDQFMERAVRISVGGLSPTINWKDLKEQVFEVPTIKEQKELADKLWAAYRLKESYKDLLVTTDEMVKSRFIEMFSSRQLPLKHLPDLSENLDKKRVPITSGDRKSGKYPYYGASGIVDYVNDYIFDETLLLISEDGANLKDRVTPIAFQASGKFWVNNHAHVLRFDSSAMMLYIEYLINGMDIEKYLTGMAQPKLNQKELNAIPIPVPSDSELQRFQTLIIQADKSKFELKQAIEKIDKVMRALIQ